MGSSAHTQVKECGSLGYHPHNSLCLQPVDEAGEVARAKARQIFFFFSKPNKYFVLYPDGCKKPHKVAHLFGLVTNWTWGESVDEGSRWYMMTASTKGVIRCNWQIASCDPIGFMRQEKEWNHSLIYSVILFFNEHSLLCVIIYASYLLFPVISFLRRDLCLTHLCVVYDF